jgi:formylmethanofuran dehydrogenase subunit E
MTDTDLQACFTDLEDKEAFDEHYRDMASPDDEAETPTECQRCGNEFGGAAIKIGNRFVCTPCEEAEYTDYTFDLEQALNEKFEDDFSAQRDEPW